MADKRISQLIERVDIANNDVLPIVASGATTTNKVTISTIQDWMQSNLDVGVTSVGLTMPSAFQVSGSPITTSGNITVTAAGTASQYIRGDGTLADFPQGGGGGGASVSYYLNGSVSQGTIGGVAYLEMNKTPVLGAGTDFNISADGYIASFITDAGDPALLEIPAGNWNFETYFQASSGGGTPSFYVELYKVSGATATLIASNSANPELIAFGTSTTPYFSALAVPQTTLALTDRLAIRIYVVASGRTITLHTENSNLCQIITTFTTGLTALNGLTAQVQNFATGTSGSNFGITSSGSIHTFNLPDASASARGVVTTGSQIFGGVKTFADGLSLPSAGGTNQASRFVNIGTIHQGTGGSNQIGFNNSNNIYFGKGLDNGGVIQWSNSAVRYYTLPNADGTIALTSDLGNYVPYTGATSNVDLGSNSLSSRNLIANGGLNTGALLLKNANNASLIDTGYFKLCPNSNNTEISFGFSTGASTWKQFNLSSTFITNNTVTTFYLPNGGGTLALTSDLGAYLPLTGGTLTGALNGTSANFSDTLIASKSSAGASVTVANTGSNAQLQFSNSTHQAQIGIANLGSGAAANTFYINTSAGTIGSGITMNDSGAVTFANKITINTPSDGIGVLLNGRTSDNFSSIRFGANTGGGQYNSINVSSSSFDIISIGNTPITFGTNSAGGGGTRMTIGGDGTITLAGALNGTSASFTGKLSVTQASTDFVTEITNTASANPYGLRIKDASSGANGYPLLSVSNNAGSVEYFRVNSGTGAATFSSSVTAASANLNRSSLTASNPLLWSTSGTLDWFLGSSPLGNSTSDLSLYSYGTSSVVFHIAKSTGNVGIGTPSPGYRLDVLFNNTTDADIFRAGMSGVSNGFTIQRVSSNFRYLFNDGNVGIGTASPTRPLVIYNSSAATLYQTPTSGTTANDGFYVGQTSDVSYVWNYNNFPLAFGTNNTERMRITSEGHVGIGTGSTSIPVRLSGRVLAINDTSANFQPSIELLRNGASSGEIFVNSDNMVIGSFESTIPLCFRTQNSERMRITSGGDVLINKQTLSGGSVGVEFERNSSTRMTTDGNTVLLLNRLSSDGTIVDIRRSGTQVGTISVTTTATSYNTSSDYRLKENVKPVENALSLLTQLKPCTFNFIANEEQEVIGFIAHEVQEVIPQAVTGEKDAVRIEQVEVSPAELDEEGNVITEAVIEEKEVPVYQGIDHSKLVPLLVASIQELKAEIEALKSQING